MMNMLGHGTFFALALSLGLGACAGQISGPDQLLAFSKEVYFGGPNDKHVVAERILVRWNVPLRVSLDGLDAAAYRNHVGDLLTEFTRLTGLRANLVEAPGDANLTIDLLDDATFKVNGAATTCVANVRDSKGDIQRVRIHIAVTEPSRVERCLAHELYHAFGLRFHSAAAASVLSAVHGEIRPTAADKQALAMLYDPGLHPGAALHEVVEPLRGMTARANGDFGQQWTSVLPKSSRIQVGHKAAEKYVSRYMRSRSPLKHLTTEIAYWRGPAMYRPVAILKLVTADAGYFIDDVPSFQDHLASMVKFNNSPIRFSYLKKRKGRYGLVDTIGLQIDESECLGFRQRLGKNSRVGGNTDIMVGYLCADPGVSMNMDFVGELLQSVNIRGVY